MRLDRFLKATGLFKTRTEAKRALDSGRVRIGGAPVKPSREVRTGEVLEVDRPSRTVRVKVRGIPFGRSVPRKDRSLYMDVEETCFPSEI